MEADEAEETVKPAFVKAMADRQGKPRKPRKPINQMEAGKITADEMN